MASTVLPMMGGGGGEVAYATAITTSDELANYGGQSIYANPEMYDSANGFLAAGKHKVIITALENGYSGIGTNVAIGSWSYSVDAGTSITTVQAVTVAKGDKVTLTQSGRDRNGFIAVTVIK